MSEFQGFLIFVIGSNSNTPHPFSQREIVGTVAKMTTELMTVDSRALSVISVARKVYSKKQESVAMI